MGRNGKYCKKRHQEIRNRCAEVETDEKFKDLNMWGIFLVLSEEFNMSPYTIRDICNNPEENE